MTEKIQCHCVDVRERTEFEDWNDYDEHELYIRRNLAFFEVPVERPYLNVGFTEKWYQCSNCKRIWRLVEPDPPFRGLWKEVNEKDLSR